MNITNKVKKINLLRLFFFLVLVVFFLFLLGQALVPGGRIVYERRPGRDNFFIKKLTPAERVAIAGKEEAVIGDPAYFSLFVPRTFDRATLKLKFRPVGGNPIVEAGLLADRKNWRYELRPLENRHLDDLAGWEALSGNGLTLFQKKKIYGSVDAFLKKPPPFDAIAAYNYELKTAYAIAGYAPQKEPRTIGVPLRGSFQLYAYIKNEPLKFSFVYDDLNENLDRDDIDIFVFRGGEKKGEWLIKDEGLAEGGKTIDRNKKARIEIGDLPEGAYKVEFKARDDIVVRKIETGQHRLAFAGPLWLAQSDASSTTLFTDSREVSAKTMNPASLAEAKIGDEKLTIAETFKQSSVLSGDGLKKTVWPKSDVIISGDGLWSFGEGSFFNPQAKKIGRHFSAADEMVKFIIADYTPPRREGEWLVNEAAFDLRNAYRENGRFTFLISVPGLRADDGIVDKVEIGGIEIILEGKTLAEKLGEAWDEIKK